MMNVFMSVLPKRFRNLGIVALIAGLFMFVGVPLASACTWEATRLVDVHTARSKSSDIVGHVNDAQEFFGSCTKTDGWITVNDGAWNLWWSPDTPPYDYVIGSAAVLLSN